MISMDRPRARQATAVIAQTRRRHQPMMISHRLQGNVGHAT